MTKINELKKTGIVSKEITAYEIFKMGNCSYIIRSNNRPVEYVFDSEADCIDYINSFPEF